MLALALALASTTIAFETYELVAFERSTTDFVVFYDEDASHVSIYGDGTYRGAFADPATPLSGIAPSSDFVQASSKAGLQYVTVLRRGRNDGLIYAVSHDNDDDDNTVVSRYSIDGVAVESNEFIDNDDDDEPPITYVQDMEFGSDGHLYLSDDPINIGNLLATCTGGAVQNGVYRFHGLTGAYLDQFVRTCTDTAHEPLAVGTGRLVQTTSLEWNSAGDRDLYVGNNAAALCLANGDVTGDVCTTCPGFNALLGTRSANILRYDFETGLLKEKAIADNDNGLTYVSDFHFQNRERMLVLNQGCPRLLTKRDAGDEPNANQIPFPGLTDILTNFQWDLRAYKLDQDTGKWTFEKIISDYTRAPDLTPWRFTLSNDGTIHLITAAYESAEYRISLESGEFLDGSSGALTPTPFIDFPAIEPLRLDPLGISTTIDQPQALLEVVLCEPAGAACDDNDPYTSGDKCFAGQCRGAFEATECTVSGYNLVIQYERDRQFCAKTEYGNDASTLKITEWIATPCAFYPGTTTPTCEPLIELSEYTGDFHIVQDHVTGLRTLTRTSGVGGYFIRYTSQSVTPAFVEFGAPFVVRKRAVPVPQTAPLGGATVVFPLFSSLVGDPHVKGPNGEVFDFGGRAGEAYALFSSPHFAVNARMALEGPQGHFMSHVIVLYRSLTIDASSVLLADDVDRAVAKLNAQLAPLGASAKLVSNHRTLVLALCDGQSHVVVARHEPSRAAVQAFALVHLAHYFNVDVDVPGCHDDFGGLIGQLYQCKFVSGAETFVWDATTQESFHHASLAAKTGAFDADVPCFEQSAFGVHPTLARQN